MDQQRSKVQRAAEFRAKRRREKDELQDEVGYRVTVSVDGVPANAVIICRQEFDPGANTEDKTRLRPIAIYREV